MSDNVCVYAVFAGCKISRSGTSQQIWAKACGGTEQAFAAYTLLYDVHVFL